MKKKVEYESNLLQDLFDLVWGKYSNWYDRVFQIRNPQTDFSEIFPTLPDRIDYVLPKRKSKEGIFIPVGDTFKNKQIILDLKSNPHSYVVGTTGSGKSNITKVILSTLISMYKPSELELYLADCKRVELNLFRNVQHCKKFVYKVEDITALIANLLQETNKRYDLFVEHEVTDIFEYNELKGVKKLKYQVLYIEEIVMLLEDKKKNAMRLLKQLIAISRASGLYVFLTTQRPDNTIIDNVVKANINNRIVFKCEDSKNSVVALDTVGAELLKGHGHGLIKRGSNLEEFQGYYITNDKVKEIIKPFKKPKINSNKPTDELVKNKAGKSNDESQKVRTIKNDSNNIIDLSFLDNL